MKNAKNIYLLLPILFLACSPLAHAEGYTYTRTPSGNVNAQTVTVSIENFDKNTDVTMTEGDASQLEICSFALWGSSDGGTWYEAMRAENEPDTFSADLTSASHTFSTRNFESINDPIYSVRLNCLYSAGGTGYAILEQGETGEEIIFSMLFENTTYGGMFGTEGGTELTGNLSNFIAGSGIMKIVLLFIGVTLAFYVINKLIKQINPKKEEKTINEDARATGRNLKKFIE